MEPQLILKILFSSGLRIRILTHFFFHPGETIHVRGLATALDEPAGTVARELANLERGAILQSKAIGNQKHYSLNENNAILEDLRNIFLKVSGAGSAIRDVLGRVPDVEIAFIIGSYADGRATAVSDLDLMIVGDTDKATIAPLIAEVEENLGRPINYALYPRSEVKSRLGREGDFLNGVFSAKRHLLIGNTDDSLLAAP
ncbi:MAG: nucleotidyltransferase domain-containing protein [Syntrophobacteria bacterium]